MSDRTLSLLNLFLLAVAMLLTENTAAAARQCMSADDFSAMCSETMKSDEITEDKQMSQREFSRFLNGLPCLFIDSPSNAEVKECSRSEFYDLPFNIRFYFVKKVCRQIDDPNVEEDDCQNNLADNELSPEKFGFVSTKDGFKDNVDELCGGLYNLLGDDFIPAKACPSDTSNAGDAFDDKKDELRTAEGGTEESNSLNPGIFIGIGLGLLFLLVLILLCVAWRRRKSKEVKDDGENNGAITSPADVEKSPQDLEAAGAGAGAGTAPDDAMTKASSDGDGDGSSGDINIQRTETVDSASTAGGGASPPRAQDAPTPVGSE